MFSFSLTLNCNVAIIPGKPARGCGSEPFPGSTQIKRQAIKETSGGSGCVAGCASLSPATGCGWQSMPAGNAPKGDTGCFLPAIKRSERLNCEPDSPERRAFFTPSGINPNKSLNTFSYETNSMFKFD